MKILIAEDQATSALFLRRLLEALGHEVAVAVDGNEAWRIVREGQVPLVISDWMMPGMDGLELCRRIRDRAGLRYTYVILLTSKDLRAERLEGLRAGADDFLVKPPDSDELAVKLEIAQRILGVQAELERLNLRLAELVSTDGLTGVRNRRSFDECLQDAYSFATRQRLPLSLVMIDVDHFKSFNDTFGHPAGDDVLRAVAGLLRDNIRDHDQVARYGGEEFVLLLPATDARAGCVIAERLRAAIAGHPWTSRPISISLGVATTSDGTRGVSGLLDEADKALYRSKQQGRDRITHFAEMSQAAREWATGPHAGPARARALCHVPGAGGR
jgi:two-component system cell cycle response regulator